jgi:predicted nucleic acid-binding protein
MKALIDTNVLIDVIQEREPFYLDSKKVLRLVAERKIEGYVSVQSLKDIYYVTESSKMMKDPFKPIEQISFFFNIIDVSGEDSISALTSDVKDYEDALLGFSAMRNGIKTIITRNKKDFSELEMVVVDPRDISRYLCSEVKIEEAVIDKNF